MTTIVSYNVNSFRSATEKGLLDWIDENNLDVVCLQETKSKDGKVPRILVDSLGYHHHWHHAEQSGYSGVATFSKRKPSRVISGTGIEKYDQEGRVLRTDFDDWTLLNCYFPNGGRGEERQQFKMRFLDDFYALVDNLLMDQPNLIVVGDYNIAHAEIDLAHPGRHHNTSGFLPEERQWMTQFMQNGMVDAFRHLYPDKVEYSWWRFNPGVREKNLGWRYDYMAVSDALIYRVKDVRHLKHVEHSDHCPVWMEIEN